MATKTGPNLEPGRRAIERLMDDACNIVRPTDADDENVDPTTLEVIPVVAMPVYSGKCLIVERGDVVPTDSQIGLAFRNLRYYHITIPIKAPPIREGDIITATSSRRDPLLVGTIFIASSAVVGTLEIARDILATRQ